MRSMQLKKLIAIIETAVFIGFILIVSYLFIEKFGDIIKNPLKIREMMVGYGAWGYLIFSLLNIFQIFFAPVPGTVLTVSSGILFGFTKGILVTWISVIIGGSATMIVSRFFGKKILFYLLKEKTKKFETEITRRGIPFIIILSIFPNPIGDGLFYLAGITDVPLKILIPVIALGRLPGIIVLVLIGDRLLCAGVQRWIIAGAGFLMAVIFYLLFAKKLEILFTKIVKKNQ